MIAGISKQRLDKDFPADAAIVVLHPNFLSQHLLLNLAFRQTQRQFFYVTIHDQRRDLPSTWSMISDLIVDQRQTPLPPLSEQRDLASAARTVMKHLQAIGDFALVFDSFDLADDTLQAWTVELGKAMPSQSQVIVGGRSLPISLITAPSLAGKIKLFPTDESRMLIDYTQQPSSLALLEVYALGPGRVFINGRYIDRWDGILPRSLFFYLVDRGLVTRDEVFHTFWPTLTIREATNVFHVTKRKITEIVGFDLTTYSSGFYRLSPDVNLQYDVSKFIDNTQHSMSADTDTTARNLLESAIGMYRGQFLSNLDMLWANQRRKELDNTFADALSNLGKLSHKKGNKQEALGLYLRATRTQPHREDIIRGMMILLTEMGQPDKALEIYQKLVDDLKKTVGIRPDKQTSELAERLKASLKS